MRLSGTMYMVNTDEDGHRVTNSVMTVVCFQKLHRGPNKHQRITTNVLASRTERTLVYSVTLS